jgi:mono/diheme cytochrome c family protein
MVEARLLQVSSHCVEYHYNRRYKNFGRVLFFVMNKVLLRKMGRSPMKRNTLIALGTLLMGSALSGPAIAAAKDGEPVYTAKCKNCHGADGTGNPAIAKMMNVTMKPLGASSDADIKAAITNGTGKMKPIAGISPADIDNVVAYVKTLKK